MLIKRGADCNIEDDHGARPDDIASIAASIAAKEVSIYIYRYIYIGIYRSICTSCLYNSVWCYSNCTYVNV